MPKDEFDFEDPMELNGVTLHTDEDTTDLMCECFIEEFLRLGYNPKQVLALFANPHYLGMNLVWQRRGAEYVHEQVQRVFAQWGRPNSLPNPQTALAAAATDRGSIAPPPPSPAPVGDWEAGVADPTGGPIPKLQL